MTQTVRARIPTHEGEFTLCYFENSLDHAEHLALVHGDVEGRSDVLVRIHSECFTGDVLGSLRCDCGEQLTTSLSKIAEEGAGVLLYLRQEGRGIGLAQKLRAYNLQDQGYDTVDANLLLGHQADERDYRVAALMLHHLNIASVRLLTNNPHKMEALQQLGIEVSDRIALTPHVNGHNVQYLQAKVMRMQHLLNLGPLEDIRSNHHPDALSALEARARQHAAQTGLPFVTLSYAQSLDGCIAAVRGRPMRLSGSKSITYTHKLRSLHDGILVGIGTVEADDPRLTVRHVDGTNPRPIILDTSLRISTDVRLLHQDSIKPIIVTSTRADSHKIEQLTARGVHFIEIPPDESGWLPLSTVLEELGALGLRSVMVEGGARVITSFLREGRAHRIVLTIVNMIVGGLHAVGPLSEPTRHRIRTEATEALPRLDRLRYRWLGDDLIIEGNPVWDVVPDHAA